MSSLLGVGGGLGVVLAGPIVEQLNYHWLFWIPLVVTVAVTFATARYVPESPVAGAGQHQLARRGAAVGRTRDRPARGQPDVDVGLGLGRRRSACCAIGAAVLVAWVLVELRSAVPARRHGDDAHQGRLDDERRRLPGRRRHVLVVHPAPAVRAGAQEHRLRLRGLGAGVRPGAAAVHGRDACSSASTRAGSSSASARASACSPARRSRPRRSCCWSSRARTSGRSTSPRGCWAPASACPSARWRTSSSRTCARTRPASRPA